MYNYLFIFVSSGSRKTSIDSTACDDDALLICACPSFIKDAYDFSSLLYLKAIALRSKIRVPGSDRQQIAFS